MEANKLKDITEKLRFLKDYSSLVIPVVITMVGVIVFVLALLMGSKFKDKVTNESIPKGDRIKSLSNQVVSSEQEDEEKKYYDDYERDANEIVTLARQSSERVLLSDKIFPEAKDSSSLLFEEFAKNYRDGIDLLLADINALDCPSEAELEKSISGGSSLSGSARSRRQRRPTSLISGSNDAKIRNILCEKKAEGASVYTNAADLSGYEFWEEYEYPGLKGAVEDCWHWQLGYWIIEDIIDTIKSMNSGSDTVYTSPVKRLVSVDFTPGGASSGGSRGSRIRRTNNNRPSYVTTLQEGFTPPYTGRLCNNDIDVVHFNVVVLIDVKKVLPFMDELSSAKEHAVRQADTQTARKSKHNQITILKDRLDSIDLSAEEHKLYRYGKEDAVVKMELVCEYIFNKSGYDTIMPNSVKESLKKPEETTTRRGRPRPSTPVKRPELGLPE